MHDAHFHISNALLEQTKNQYIPGIVNAASIKEYEYLTKYPYTISAGIHPWYVDKMDYDTFLPYLEKASIIGEIGLDDTWCSTDLDLQREIFEIQLEYASMHHKPVILHLKGMEKEAYSCIKKYPNTYIVHWHSTKEMIQEYIDYDCFFTIGPSIGIDEAVNEVCKLCPMDRMLIETDGIEAIAWAMECKNEEVSYIETLQRSIEWIAQIKHCTYQQVEQQIDKNFQYIIEMNK